MYGTLITNKSYAFNMLINGRLHLNDHNTTWVYLSLLLFFFIFTLSFFYSEHRNVYIYFAIFYNSFEHLLFSKMKLLGFLMQRILFKKNILALIFKSPLNASDRILKSLLFIIFNNRGNLKTCLHCYGITLTFSVLHCLDNHPWLSFLFCFKRY